MIDVIINSNHDNCHDCMWDVRIDNRRGLPLQTSRGGMLSRLGEAEWP